MSDDDLIRRGDALYAIAGWEIPSTALAALAAAVPDDLAEAGKVLEGVTPGPWAVDALQLGTQGDITTADGEIYVAQAQMRLPMASGKKDAERAANARFIAWCREGVPALLAQIAALRAERDSARTYAAEVRLREKAAEDARIAAEAALAAERAKVAKLVEAGKALQADMLERARIGTDAIHGEEYRIVNAGRTAWADFCAAITEAGQ